MKRLGWVGALLGVLMAVLGSSLATAGGGGGGGGGGEVSANVSGTGKIIANGQAAWVNFVITCPKGAAWSVDAGAGFNFVSETGEQSPDGWSSPRGSAPARPTRPSRSSSSRSPAGSRSDRAAATT